MAVPSIERPTKKKWLLVVCRCTGVTRLDTRSRRSRFWWCQLPRAGKGSHPSPEKHLDPFCILLFRVKLTVHATAISPNLSQTTAYWSKAGDAASKCHVQPERTAIVMQTSRKTSFGTCFYGLPIRALPMSGKVRCSARGRRRYQT